jgi:hypothetical protein
MLGKADRYNSGLMEDGEGKQKERRGRFLIRCTYTDRRNKFQCSIAKCVGSITS